MAVTNPTSPCTSSLKKSTASPQSARSSKTGLIVDTTAISMEKGDPCGRNVDADKAKIARLRTDYNKTAELALHYMDRNTGLRAERSSLGKNLQEVRAESILDKKEIRELKGIVDGLNKKLEYKEKEANYLSDQLGKAEEQERKAVQQVRAQCQQMKERAEKAEAQLSSEKQQMDKELQKSQEGYKEKLDGVLAAVKKREEKKIGEHEEEVRKLKEMVEKKTGEHKVCQTKLLQSHQEKEALEAELKAAMKKLNTEKEEHDIQIQQNHQLEADIGKLHVTLTKSRMEFGNRLMEEKQALLEKEKVVLQLQEQLSRFLDADAKACASPSKKRKIGDEA